MRVGILSYPMLFERESALQAQVRATIGALAALSSHGAGRPQVELANPWHTGLDDYDVLHVFGATAGNDRLVEAAARLGVPVVLSPLLGPGWDRAQGARANMADRLLVRLARAGVQSSYAKARRALQAATLLVAHGETEMRTLAGSFRVGPARLRTFPHGVSARYFDADGDIFRARTGIVGPFALMAGPLSRSDQQRCVVQAMAELALPLVIAGGAGEAPPGVHHLDAAADERMYASACAAASVFVQCGSTGDVPQAALEALAAGAPLVGTSLAAPGLRNVARAVRLVRPGDIGAIKRATMAFLAEALPRSCVRSLVRECAWERVAEGIASCYVEAIGLAGGAQRRRTVSSSDL
jgi:hypothetical protein